MMTDKEKKILSINYPALPKEFSDGFGGVGFMRYSIKNFPCIDYKYFNEYANRYAMYVLEVGSENAIIFEEWNKIMMKHNR